MITINLNKVIKWSVGVFACSVILGGGYYIVHNRYMTALAKLESTKAEQSKLQATYDKLLEEQAENIYYVQPDGTMSASATDLTYSLIEDTLTKMFTYSTGDEFRANYDTVSQVLAHSDYFTTFYGDIDTTTLSIQAHGIVSTMTDLSLTVQSDGTYLARVAVKRIPDDESSNDIMRDTYVFTITSSDDGLRLVKINK